MPRKSKLLCNYRFCEKPRTNGKWCSEHYALQWNEADLTIDRAVMREVTEKIDLLARWNENSAFYLHDLCSIVKRLLIEAGGDLERLVDPTWMFLFEAEKWQNGLNDDVHTCLDEITDLIYPEGVGH